MSEKSESTINVSYNWNYSSCYEGMDASYYALQNENARLLEENKRLRAAQEAPERFKRGDIVIYPVLQCSMFEDAEKIPLYPMAGEYVGRLSGTEYAVVKLNCAGECRTDIPYDYLCATKAEWEARYKKGDFDHGRVAGYKAN